MTDALLDEYARGAYQFRYATTSVTCDRCGLAVDVGAVAIRVFDPNGSGSDRCVSCALDCSVFELRYALREEKNAFEGRAAIESALEARIAAMIARARGAPVECVPARDHTGKPRVKALVHGLVINRVSATGKAFWTQLRAGCAFASARREYAFHIPAGDDSMRSSDPAQPLVAYVYGLNARPADALTQSRDDRVLRDCFKRKFPAPLLWLQGVTEKSARDKHIPRAREIVERAGFDADQCPVLCAKTMDRAALEALVDAMDEHFSGNEIAPIAAKKD